MCFSPLLGLDQARATVQEDTRVPSGGCTQGGQALSPGAVAIGKSGKHLSDPLFRKALAAAIDRSRLLPLWVSEPVKTSTS